MSVRLDKTFLILKKLYESPDYVSGQAIGVMLGMSRAGVLRHMEKLRAKGFSIESESRKGHRLTAIGGYSDDSIRILLKRDLEVRFVEETESTNLLAKREAGEEGLVVAERQSGGRGRKDRKFSSESGGVYLSYFVRPEGMLPGDAVKTVLFGGLSVVRMLKRFGIDGTLKWPNDVFVGGRKISGILSEMIASTDEIARIVVGVGVNVNNDPGLPTAVSLSELTGREISRNEVAAGICDSLRDLFEEFRENGFGEIRTEYLACSCTVGNRVLVVQENESFEADALDVDENGYLIVERGSGAERVVVGDVTVRESRGRRL